MSKIAMKTNRSIIPASIRPNLVGLWSGKDRKRVVYGLTNLVQNGSAEVTLINSSGAFSTSTEGVVNGSKIYIRADIKKQAPSTTYLRFEDNALATYSPTLVADTYTTVSYIGITISSATIKFFGFYDGSLTTLMKNRIAINLTAIFGPGNEPTAAEMDAILLADGTPYWDGLKNVVCSPIDNINYPLTNLVTNGNFSGGTSGWTPLYGVGAVLNEKYTLTGDGSNYQPNVWQNVSLISGKRYYVTAMLKTIDTNCLILRIRASTITIATQSAPLQNIWYKISGIISVVSETQINLIATYSDAATANGKVMEVQNVMVFDLGDSTSPLYNLSAATLDAMLSSDRTPYWDGMRVVRGLNREFYLSDLSGNGHTGKLNGFTWVGNSNVSNDGVTFDNAVTYMTIPDSPSTRLVNGGTLFAWIRPRSFGEVGGRIIDKSSTITGTDGYLLYLASNTKISGTVNGSVTTQASDSIMLNQWQFVTYTFDATGRYLYTNGVDVTVVNGGYTALPPDIAGIVTIGNRSGFIDRTFDGSIGLAGMCDRALTQGEIQQIFNLTRSYYGV